MGILCNSCYGDVGGGSCEVVLVMLVVLRYVGKRIKEA